MLLICALIVSVCFAQSDTVKQINYAKVTKLARSEGAIKSFLESAVNGNLEVVRSCIREGIDVNCKAAHGINALLLAAQEGHKSIVTELLDAAAYVNIKTDDGATPLMLAAQNGHVDIVEILIAHNA